MTPHPLPDEAGGWWELLRALRSGLRPHTRSGGYAADSIGRCAWMQAALVSWDYRNRLGGHGGVRGEPMAPLVAAIGFTFCPPTRSPPMPNRIGGLSF